MRARPVAAPAVLLLFVALLPRPGYAQPPAAGFAWRTDYNAARKEAADRGLPLLIVVGTDDCFYCRKLDASTFRTPAVAQLAANGFVPLKVDAHREPALAKALKVQVYPTSVLAGADGKIHAFIEGYLEPERYAEHMRRAATASATPDWMARDFNEAGKAVGAGDYPRAVSLLRGIVKDAGERPVGAKAREVLAGIEQQAAGRLAKARGLEARGATHEAMDELAGLMKTFSGTQAAADAAGLLAGLADRPETRETQRSRLSRDLLASARDDFRAARYHDCLQRCDQLTTAFADRPEARDAAGLAAEVRDNPDRLAAACEQMNEKTAAMYLTLAESWQRRGNAREAAACLDRVTKLVPGTRQAELAQTRLAAIQGRDPATAAGFQRP
ncbi:MAG TPA: thioredoxin family protein [Urbifossiella sp.]|nr:thioredoxin family protein [Urbifossiella sp.]